MASASTATTIDPDEVEKFSTIAAEWWDPYGKFKPLHKFNPHRLTHIRNEICEHFDRDSGAKEPLKGLRLIDIGCGGGLVSEPMCRMGATVTGIDAAEKNIKTALAHAIGGDLEINYQATTVEDIVESERGQYDVVLNLEVVEHVADVNLFLKTSAELVKPGGIIIVATINKTLKALATAKIGAEYILRWLPAGTHDPRKFIRPQDIQSALTESGLQANQPVGISYVPILDTWRITRDVSVNYMVSATRQV